MLLPDLCPVHTIGPRLDAALFTVFVKGAGFSSMCTTQCAKKGRIGISRREKRMEDKKTRTLVQHKGAAPEIQNRSKAGAPGVNLVLDCKALTITDEVQSRETRSDRNER
jgi:hypothetical protein